MWLLRAEPGADGPCRVCGGDLFQEEDYEARLQLSKTGITVMKCLLCGREYDYDPRVAALTGPISPEISLKKFAGPAMRRTKVNPEDFGW